jgi:hypothetical protein
MRPRFRIRPDPAVAAANEPEELTLGEREPAADAAASRLYDSSSSASDSSSSAADPSGVAVSESIGSDGRS